MSKKDNTNSKKGTKKPKQRPQPMSPKSGIGRHTKYACGGKLKK